MKPLNPFIDERDFESMLKYMRAMAPFYTSDWESKFEKGSGIALLKIYLYLLNEVIKRLNGVPHKNQVAFLDMMGIKMLPAQWAKVPLTFSLAEGTPKNVLVPKGTQVAGQKQNEAGEEQEVIFQTQDDLSVTNALLEEVFSVDAATDSIYHHTADFAEGKSFVILKDDNRNKQEHSFYIGHKDLFNQKKQSEIKIDFKIESGAVESSALDFVWEYFNGEDWAILAPLRRNHSLDYTRGFQRSGTMTLEKNHSGEIKPTEVGAVENHWIRCRLTDELSGIDAEQLPVFDTIELTVKSTEIFEPDLAFSNDVPVDLSGEFLPFGEMPQQRPLFYIASNEAFSKKGATIYIEVDARLELHDSTSEPDLSPVLSWEYWNGEGWRGLSIVGDDHSFTKSFSISFTCPNDIEVTEVNGEENFWIRIRLVDGDYGVPIIFEYSSVWLFDVPKQGKIYYPIITELNIEYEQIGQVPENCLIFNNLVYTDRSSECRDKNVFFQPFQLLPEKLPSFLMGFDKPTQGGPLRILFDIEERQLSDDSQLKLGWYYWDGSQWIQITVEDKTENLTQIGIVQWIGNRNIDKQILFGKDLYWLKACFANGVYSQPPRILGIYPNSVNAFQAAMINQEILGGSDATGNQKFFLFKPLVISQQIWIKEPEQPDDKSQKVILQEEGDGAIRKDQNEEGEEEIWIRWHEVEDFDDSGPTSRHYTINRRQGIIHFGDGVQGLIPPPGVDNIMADYNFGGGKIGNVLPETLTGLKNSIQFVQAVQNIMEADDGSETETLEQVLERGSQKLKNRSRAVTSVDYEWMVYSASRKVARAKCLPNVDKNGDSAPGQVTVMIVPDSKVDKPLPTTQLIYTVTEVLESVSANTVSAPGHIHVRPPVYSEIVVEADVIITDLNVAAAVENDVLTALKRYLHPLTGGPEIKGWNFGDTICRSEIYAILENIIDVDVVEKILLFSDGTLQDADIQLNPFSLPFSGAHIINLKLLDHNSF
jgi:hypothetical protein